MAIQERNHYQPEIPAQPGDFIDFDERKLTENDRAELDQYIREANDGVGLTSQADPVVADELIDSDDIIGLYIRQALSFPLLPLEIQLRLGKQKSQGAAAELAIQEENLGPETVDDLQSQIDQGKAAQEMLILSNTRLVVSVAKKYQGRGVPFLDLIQEGNLGLIHAVGRYNYRRGFAVNTSATWWIRQRISLAVSQQSRVIRVPSDQTDRLQALHRAQADLEQVYGREPSIEELAGELGVRESRIRQLLRIDRQEPISLDQPARNNPDNSLGDIISDPDGNPEAHIEQEYDLAYLQSLMSELSPRHRRILELKMSDEKLTMGQIAEIEARMMSGERVSPQRIRQLLNTAIERLRLAHLKRQDIPLPKRYR